MSDATVTCASCGAIEEVDVAVDGGEWVPYYWDEALCPPAEVGPTCPDCVAVLNIIYDATTGEHYRTGGARG